MTEDKIELSAMPTPNPNAIKFLPGYNIFESGTVDFPNEDSAKGSLLPEALFDIDGVDGVMVGFNFVSVVKDNDTSWEEILEHVRDTIVEILELEEDDPIDMSLIEKQQQSSEDDSESVQKIKQILDDEIRPAIAMDGGDVSFTSFVDGILTLHLQGACSSCPASTMTLKMGIENRLREEIPDLKEVVQV